MLVLSRKVGEQVLIPQLNITVTVLSAGPGRVQLGIKAPKEIDITRPEYRKQILADEAVEASTTGAHNSFADFSCEAALC